MPRSYSSGVRKARTRNQSRTKQRAARPEFTATMPKGLSPAEQKAWEAAAKKAGSGNYWKPKDQGDFVTGKLISAEMRKSQFGPQRNLVLQPSKGAPITIGCTTVLESEYDSVEPKVGDTIMIVFQGTKPSKKGGRPMQLYGMTLVAKGKAKG